MKLTSAIPEPASPAFAATGTTEPETEPPSAGAVRATVGSVLSTVFPASTEAVALAGVVGGHEP